MTMKGQAIFRGTKEVLLLLSVCTIACNADCQSDVNCPYGYVCVNGKCRRYVLKAANDLCSSTGVIESLYECISSIVYLKERGVDVVFKATESDAGWPKGCYKHSNKDVYWNTHSSGNANQFSRPICREGYRKADNSHACCIAPGSLFHQRCHCQSLPLSKCMQFCNEDVHCKGYVASGGSCQIATTASCPSGCNSYDVGNVGKLLSDGTCGGGYGGCFIKNERSSVKYRLVRRSSECNSSDKLLGKNIPSASICARLCDFQPGCKFFILGTNGDLGKCYWEKTNYAYCPEGWDHDTYNFYELTE